MGSAAAPPTFWRCAIGYSSIPRWCPRVGEGLSLVEQPLFDLPLSQHKESTVLERLAMPLSVTLAVRGQSLDCAFHGFDLPLQPPAMEEGHPLESEQSQASNLTARSTSGETGLPQSSENRSSYHNYGRGSQYVCLDGPQNINTGDGNQFNGPIQNLSLNTCKLYQ